jgi:hypothetical protein
MRFPPTENPQHPSRYKAMVDYVVAKTRESKGVTPPASDIADDVLEGILEVLYALRVHFETEEGAVWLYRLTGVEERCPHVGFIYFLVDQRGRIPLNTRVSSYDQGSRSVTMYVLNTQEQKRSVTHELVESCRYWLYGKRDAHPVKSAPFIRFCLEHARDWLLGSAGLRWLQEQHGYQTRLKVYRALSLYGETAYKITDDTGTFWAGPKLKVGQQRSWVEYEPKTMRTCDSCGQKYPCIQDSESQGNLCCSCLAQTGRDSLVVLDFCAHAECKSISCPNALSLSQVRTRQERWAHVVDAGVVP